MERNSNIYVLTYDNHGYQAKEISTKTDLRKLVVVMQNELRFTPVMS